MIADDGARLAIDRFELKATLRIAKRHGAYAGNRTPGRRDGLKNDAASSERFAVDRNEPGYRDERFSFVATARHTRQR